MLNLYNNLIKNYNNKNNNIDFYSKNKNVKTIKDFPSSTREWNNSIYTFNKNYLKLIPEVSRITNNLINSYFKLYNKNLEDKIRIVNIRKRFRKLSSNKIYVSNGTFKHTNNKVIITIYVYNRQKINYTYLIEKKFKNFLLKRLSKNLLILKLKVQNYLNKVEKNREVIFEILNNRFTNKYIIYTKYKSIYNKYYNIMLYNKLIKRIFRKYKVYLLYKQLLYINKSKFNYNYLGYLSTLLKKIYNKNIEFNIVNLKYFYLNSDILTESLLLKVRRDRRKLLRKLKYLINRSKTTKVSKFLSYKNRDKNVIRKENIDPISSLIFKNTYKNKKTIKHTALNIIKYKKVTGVRIEAKGRLTKRYTASRSVYKLRYKGNIINMDSARLGISSVFLRGNLRSNLQYTKLNSKTRIGSFGLKGWVSGY